MGVTEILALITGVLQFPDAIFKYVQLLKKTPQEKHEELIQKSAEYAKQFEQTGRPVWK